MAGKLAGVFKSLLTKPLTESTWEDFKKGVAIPVSRFVMWGCTAAGGYEIGKKHIMGDTDMKELKTWVKEIGKHLDIKIFRDLAEKEAAEKAAAANAADDDDETRDYHQNQSESSSVTKMAP